MKKIAVFTLHKSHNCGSIMQAYALQEYLKANGVNPILVDFGTSKQIEEYSVYTNQKGVKGLIKKIIFFINRKTLKRHWNDYDAFRKKNLNLSEKQYNEESDISNLMEEYDAFLCGSDQIWNVTIPDYNDIYFLSFTDKCKMAYAPSFGARDPRKFVDCDNISKWLTSFDYLSTRENSGKEILKEMTDRNVQVVLDPTLLLDAENYEIIRGNSGIKGDYIFYYATLHSNKLDRFVKKVAKKYNLKVIVWSSKEYYKKMVWRNGFKLTYNQDPGIYLDLIKNASLVITTSFHGSVFSTVYRKKFWILMNGDMFKTDDRVKTMVANLGIEDRMIIPNFNDDFDYLKNVNYDFYEKNIRKLRESSKEYLSNIL